MNRSKIRSALRRVFLFAMFCQALNWSTAAALATSAGVVEWSQLISTNQVDAADGVSADSLGNVFVSGAYFRRSR